MDRLARFTVLLALLVVGASGCHAPRAQSSTETVSRGGAQKRTDADAFWALSQQCKARYQRSVASVYGPGAGYNGHLDEGPDELMLDAYRVAVGFMEEREGSPLTPGPNRIFHQANQAVICEYDDGTFGVFADYDLVDQQGKSGRVSWQCLLALSYDKWKLIDINPLVNIESKR
jgi:hypothetical protein